MYCSNYCAAQAWAKRQRAANPKPRGTTVGCCLRCGASVRGYKTKRFCGRSCAQRWLRETNSVAIRQRGRVYARAWRLRHPDRVRAQRQRDRDRIREVIKQWRLRNLVKSREYSARYRSKNRERVLETVRRYHALHTEERRRAAAEWRKRNPGRHASIQAARRARELKAQGSHTHAEWLAMVDLFDRCCAYCGQRGPLTRDHVVPLARGGTNWIDNIVPACRICNARKNVSTRDEYRARIARGLLAG